MKLLVLHRRSALGALLLLLSAVVLALPVAASAKDMHEGVKIGAAGWSQVSVVGNSSDTAGGADHNGKSALTWGAQVSLKSRVSDRLSIATGVGLAAGHSMFSMPGDPTGYAPLGVGAYVSEANFTYNFGSRLFLRGGMFSYIYNPDIKNLGLYLLRGPVYPGFVVSGFETKHVLPVANMWGLQLHHEMGDFRQDFIVSSETEFYPYFDISPAYIAGYRPHPSLDVGAGVNFYHYIPVDGKLTTDKSYNYVQGDTAGNPVDTINISFRGIKLMARASFDPKVFIGAGAGPLTFGSEDLKIYGEVALIGLDNTDAHKDMYGELRQRMPVMFGVNLPVFRALDHLSFEMEWYGAPFHDDMEPYLTGYNKPSLFPVGWYGTPTKNNNTDQNVTRDNWKWSLHGARMIQNHVRLSFQVANDHWRPGIYRGDGDTKLPKRQAIMITPEDWYFTTKLAYFF
jgi:hypothetical protein